MENVGAAVHEATARDMLRTVQEAERCGVPQVWLTTGTGPDALAVFAAAAASTSTIRMGTAIVPTFPRHPLVVAQQAADIAQLAPGRFTLGLGPSHAAGIEGRYGIPYQRPLQHLREYVAVVKAALGGEAVDFDGKRLRAHGRLPYGAEVPVMISALRERSFELAGEIADGAITWICPAPYLRRVALPALARGAGQAGRTTPPLIAHAFLCLTADRPAMVAAAGERMGIYPRSANYQGMFEAAGFPEARQGAWSDAMLDAVIVWGEEQRAETAARRFLDTSGTSGLILSVMPPAGQERSAATRRALEFVAGL